jgi:hypothetical protein
MSVRSISWLLIAGSALLTAACGGGGSSPILAPVVSLSASPTTLVAGNSATLTWTSTSATSCSAAGSWSGTVATSGTYSTGSLDDDADYSLSCKGPGGTSQTASITITVNALPTAQLAATPTAVPVGSGSTLTWSSAHASACTASGDWNGALAVSGSVGTGALTQNATYSLICTGPGGMSPQATATVTVIRVPTVTLAATPVAVAVGGSSTLTWSSMNADSCTASGGWGGTLATSGSQGTGPLTATTVYSMTCAGPGGITAPVMASVNILPQPAVTLKASPAAVAAGASSILTWTSSNAASCTASGGWSGSLALSGSQSTGPVASPTSYSLSCTGSGGTSSASAVVNLIPTATLVVSPSVVAPGGTSTLTWTSNNATSCTASNGWTGTLPTGGTQSTAAVSSTTSYSLVCNGAGGASNTATATLTVSNVTMSLSPQTAAITLTRTQQFTATVPGGGDATWTVDGVANGNSTVGVISATGLYTAGVAGTHTIVATSVANSAQSASAVAAVTDLPGVYTYHNDLARDGANTQEYALTPANVNPSSFGKVASCAVDGAIYGQPLWIANVTVSGAKHNVVIVTTQHDSLFAFDADSTPCAQLWTISLIDAAHGGTSGETPVPSGAVGAGYGDIQPEIGVNGTPVIDPSTGILYVVSKSISMTPTTFYQRIHAIDITTGSEKTGSPALIAASVPGYADGSTTVAFNTKQQNQRAGLALVNGTVFVAWGSHEDSVPWYGWIMGYQYGSGAWTQTAAFNTAPNVRQGGIWMGGGAPSVDSNNQLYFLTGNGGFDANSPTAPNNDYGDSLLQVNTALQVSSYFTPSDEVADGQGDKDFGSGGSSMLADLPAGNAVTHALVCGGKDGTLYVLNRDLLGGFGDSAAVQTIPLGHGMFSTAAMWNGYLFVAGGGGPLNAYQLNSSTVQFTLVSSSSHVYGFPGSTTSVSAAATQSGLVWALDTHSYCTQQSSACGPAVLHAYDAGNLATELWNSSMTAADKAGNAVKFSVPTVANGRVYVATRGNNAGGSDNSTSTPGELEIYGLTH